MKSSILKSVSVAMIAFTAHAQAGVIPTLDPTLPKTYKACLAQGGSQTVCEALLTAPANCQAKHSQDEEAWRDCLATAAAAFHKYIATGSTAEPYGGAILPVGTRAADADYEKKVPEH